MALLGTLQVRLGLDTATFGQKFNSFAKDLEKRGKGIAKGLSGLTNFGSLIGSAGIATSLGQGIRVAGDFETTINQVAAASDLGTESIAGLSQQALDLSKAFRVFSPQQVAEGMLDLAKAGITPAEQSMGALTATMQLAATEGLALSRAAEVMAEQMGAFGLKAADTAGIADALAGASIASTASVDGLAMGLSQVGAVANLSGLTLQETAGTLALLASNGIKGSDAGTSLKTMLMRLVPQTDEAAAAMAGLGIDFTNADGSIKRISEVAEILRTRLAKLNDEQRTTAIQTIFGSDAMRAAAILTRSGAAGIDKYIAATKDKNAAERLSEARTRGFAGAMAGLKSAFESFAITLANGGFLQGLTDLANKGAELLGKLSTLPQWAKNLGLGLAIATAAIPPLALAISNIVVAGPALLTVFGAIATFLAGPWGIAIVAAAAAAFLFKDQLVAAWDGIKSWFSDWVTQNQGTLNTLRDAWFSLVDALRPLWTAIKDGFKLTADGIAAAFGTDSQGLMQAFGREVGLTATQLINGVSVMVYALADIVTWFTVTVPAATQSLLDKFTEVTTSIGTIWKRIPDDFANAWTTLTTTVTESVEALKEMWRTMDWTELGKAIVDGIILGIQNGAAAVTQAAKDMAKSVADGAKGVLGIKSPSRVFEEVGENVGQGFINGILAKVADAGAAIKRLVTPSASNTGGLSFSEAFATNFAPKAIDLNQKNRKPLVSSMVAGAGEVGGAWKLAMEESTRAIDGFVRTGELSFKKLLDSILASIASTALKGALEGLFSGIASSFTGGTAGTSGGWGDILGSVVKGFTSFEGGGYTGTGSRTGGLDGRGGKLAMVHPNETVIDHDKVRRSATRRHSGRPVINVSTPITLMPGVSREELAQILPIVKRDIIQTIPDLIARGGRYASAFGA